MTKMKVQKKKKTQRYMKTKSLINSEYIKWIKGVIYQRLKV